VYFNDNIRCYRDGKVERLFKTKGWQIIKNKANTYAGYNRLTIDYKSIKRHRLIAFCFIRDFDINDPKQQIDHIDGNKLNNAVSNLRPCNHAGNQQNKVSAKGYYYHKAAGKYFARIVINGQQINGTLRETAEEAIKDREELKKIHHTYFADQETAYRAGLSKLIAAY
jgi:hypothetical protein